MRRSGVLAYKLRAQKGMVIYMDLHDYEDVANNYDNYLEVMHSKENTYDGFQEFYEKLAQEYGAGGIIDIACGTGAVLLNLAAKGYDVCGMDLSGAMVEAAKKKAWDLGLNIPIFSANMTDFTCDRRFSLAIIARSGFLHLTTPELQRKALLNIREKLLPGGILTLNTFAPHARIQCRMMDTSPEDYSLRLEYTNSQGLRERIYNAVTYDPVSQRMYGNWKFETLNDHNETIETRIRPVSMRQTYRQEMLYLIELCGFKIAAIYGDYHYSADNNNNLVWILRRS